MPAGNSARKAPPGRTVARTPGTGSPVERILIAQSRAAPGSGGGIETQFTDSATSSRRTVAGFGPTTTRFRQASIATT